MRFAFGSFAAAGAVGGHAAVGQSRPLPGVATLAQPQQQQQQQRSGTFRVRLTLFFVFLFVEVSKENGSLSLVHQSRHVSLGTFSSASLFSEYMTLYVVYP